MQRLPSIFTNQGDELKLVYVGLDSILDRS